MEWQGVARHDVYRRLIADNGKGMSADDLMKYLNRLEPAEKSSEPGMRNFGIGAKTSLLPWNPRGVVVVSWQDGEGCMVGLERNESGIWHASFRGSGSRWRNRTDRPSPNPDTIQRLDIDFAALKPDWISEHGTILVLLGNQLNQDTFCGDPGRDEDGGRQLARNLNGRFWDLSNIKVSMVEMKTMTDKSKWPKFSRRPGSVAGLAIPDHHRVEVFSCHTACQATYRSERNS